MDVNWYSVIVAFVMSVPGILSYIAQRRSGASLSKKDEASAAAAIADAAKGLLPPLQKQIDDLQIKVSALTTELNNVKSENGELKDQLGKVVEDYDRLMEQFAILRAWSKELVTQVRALGGTPKPEPDELDKPLNPKTKPRK